MHGSDPVAHDSCVWYVRTQTRTYAHRWHTKAERTFWHCMRSWFNGFNVAQKVFAVWFLLWRALNAVGGNIGAISANVRLSRYAVSMRASDECAWFIFDTEKQPSPPLITIVTIKSM